MPMDAVKGPFSGFAQLVGFEVEEWADGRAVVALELDGRHVNRSGAMHGGVMTTIMDIAGGYAGCYGGPSGPARRAVTLSLTTSFIGQARTGRIRAVGRVRGGGQRIFASSIEVLDADDNILAIGEGTFRYRRGGPEDEA
jgi:uncharacterized protein (TIGR00369 family)